MLDADEGGTTMTERGTGRTTDQIKNAPSGAIYISPPGAVSYTRYLAQHLGRRDIQIRRPDALDHAEEWISLRSAEVVVDHAVELTDRQWETLRRIRQKLASRPGLG